MRHEEEDAERIGWPAILMAFLGAALCAALLFAAARAFSPPVAARDGHAPDVAPQANGDWHPRVVHHPWWSHHPPPPPAPPARQGGGSPYYPPTEDIPDPQLARSMETTGGADGGVGFQRFDGAGHVTSVTGEAPISVGAHCDVRVLPVVAGGFNCLVRVMCDGKLLYPNPEQSAGYVACEVQGTVAQRAVDAMPTQTDTDPLVTFDGVGQRVVVADYGAGVHSFSAQIALEPRILFIDRVRHASAVNAL